jgi:hypothetical protein
MTPSMPHYYPHIEMEQHGPNFSQPPPETIEGEEQYEVEQIVSHQCQGRKEQLQYLIKWLGYPKSDNTWEPADLVQAPVLVKQYLCCKGLTAIKALLLQPKNARPPSWNCLHSFTPSATTQTTQSTTYSAPNAMSIPYTSMTSYTPASVMNDIA